MFFIEIPDSVTSIGSFAFENCSKLTSIEIPNSVTSIGNDAFKNCDNLTSITVLENNTAYKSIDGNLYTKDGKTLIQHAIGKEATSFTIPEGVEKIGGYAFYNCGNLTSIEIPGSVTNIGYVAFGNCANLETIKIGKNVQWINETVFYDCESVKNLYYAGTINNWAQFEFYDEAWNRIYSPLQYVENFYVQGVLVTEITITAETIGRGVFSGYDKLTSHRALIPFSASTCLFLPNFAHFRSIFQDLLSKSPQN